VQKVAYGDRSTQYRTFDPAAMEVMRLRFKPAKITAGDMALEKRTDLGADGYTVEALPGGDFVLRIHHSHSGAIKVSP
jgi:hypothetical protein